VRIPENRRIETRRLRQRAHQGCYERDLVGGSGLSPNLRPVLKLYQMNFKYQETIEESGLTNCPPKECKAVRVLVYRFVFEDMNHPHNFKPVGLISPQRRNEFRDDVKKCQSLGLSMFANLIKAQRHFEYLQLKTAGKFAKMVGNCIATLSLDESDGVCTDLNERTDSHFTFYEFAGADLIVRIVNLENI
jgi:hypothetical protein